jgi:negative regulator of sigma E activity
MACAKYKDWLSDAALGALDAARDGELRAHLRECAACRAALEEERALLAAIDAGLEASVAAEPSPSFVAQVRMRVAEEAPPSRAWLAGWLPVTATAVAALILLVVWFVPRGAQQPEATPQTVVQQAPTPQVPSTAAPEASGTLLRAPVAAPVVPGRAQQEATEPEILVAADQWATVLRLYEGVQRGRVDTDFLLKPVPGDLPAIENLQVPDLSIPKLEINGHSRGPATPPSESGK